MLRFSKERRNPVGRPVFDGYELERSPHAKRVIRLLGLVFVDDAHHHTEAGVKVDASRHSIFLDAIFGTLDDGGKLKQVAFSPGGSNNVLSIIELRRVSPPSTKSLSVERQ